MPLSPGEIVNGKYRIVRLLGDGGMGSVYEAHHELLSTRVALKLLHPELSRTANLKRFLQEARASARIKSPHVVQVADADQTADGQAFIVLEYLEGRTLRELYADLDQAGQQLAVPEALDLAMQMFDGIEAAHEAGIVHRDLKPDNLMITSDKRGGPLLKILDFGIAKVDEPSEKDKNQNLTRPGSFLGTPEYMAPEQVYSANSADARSDIFSLGVILFEMLAGRRPVLADDPQQIAVAYLTGAFSKLDELRSDLPRPVVDAVHRALAPQPRDRMATVHELRLAVEPFAPARPQATRSGTSTVEPAPVLPATGPQAAFPATTSGPHPSAPPNGTVAMQLPPSSPAAGARPIPETFSYSETPGPGSAVPPTDGPTFASPGAPMSVGVARPSLSSSPVTAPAMMPEFPPVVGPPSFVPEPSMAAPPPPSLSSPNLTPPLSGVPRMSSAPSLVPWPPPVSVGPPPPPPRKSNMGLIVGLGIVFLLVAGGGTLGTLYYLGYLDLDSDPPAKTHPKPRPKPTVLPPAPHKPSSLK